MKLSSNNKPAWVVSEPPDTSKGVSSGTGERDEFVCSGCKWLASPYQKR